MALAIAIKNLEVIYAKRAAVSVPSLDIETGSFVFITGTNGAGKSTFVKALLNLIAYRGEIEIMGKSHSNKLITEYVGYVPQHVDVDRNFPITVREIIELQCRKREHCPLDPLEHLRYLNSERLVDNQISELSGGELQRVLITRSLTNDPEILILDEPMNDLDRETEDELMSLLRKLHKNGKTIIMISHDQNLVDSMSFARTLKFQDGQLLPLQK